jgi:hypothetical protein
MTRVSADLKALRHAAYTRSGGRCEITGAILPGGPDGGWALHHRRRKGMGGTNRPDTHTLPNVLALTHEAHNLRRPSAHLDVAWSRERGYLLADWAWPRLEPVWLFGRLWVLLTEHGYRRIRHDPPAGWRAGGS